MAHHRNREPGVTRGETVAPHGLLTTKEAADLLRVSPRTILNWIDDDLVPYIALPSRGRRAEYRIPRRGLLRALSANYDLTDEFREADQAVAAAEHEGFEAVAGSRREVAR